MAESAFDSQNPYAAPRDFDLLPDISTPAGEGQREYERDPRFLTRCVKFLLWTGMALNIASVVSNVMQISWLQNGPLTEEAGQANDLRQGAVGIVTLLVFILTGILFLKWMARANRNARHFGARGLSFTPNMAAGCFFIPFLNLWRPYQSMKEIWQASKDPLFWRNVTTPGILPIWWFLWIVNSIIAQVVARLSAKGDSIDELVNITYALIFSDVFDLLCALSAVAVVSGIARLQEEWVGGDQPVLTIN